MPDAPDAAGRLESSSDDLRSGEQRWELGAFPVMGGGSIVMGAVLLYGLSSLVEWSTDLDK